MQRKYIPVEQLEELRYRITKDKHRMDICADTAGLAEQIFSSYIKPIVKIYNPVISTLASHNSNFIYRARKCINKQPFDNIKDLYNPPTPSGRALSEDNVPILYASSSLQTCLSELDVKIGEIVNIASFKYFNIMGGKFWFIGQLGAFYKSQDQTMYLGDEREVQRPFYVDSPKALNSLVYMDLLINEIFSTISTSVDQYSLNRYLIENIRNNLTDKNEFYGVIFISAKDAPGINFAIYGDAITKLEPSIVNLVKINNIDHYGCIEYELLKNSKPDGDELIWPEHEPRR